MMADPAPQGCGPKLVTLVHVADWFHPYGRGARAVGATAFWAAARRAKAILAGPAIMLAEN